MDGDYVFLCGVMWCAYGQQDARSELFRAAESSDPDVSGLALAMLAQGRHSLSIENLESVRTRSGEGRKATIIEARAHRRLNAVLCVMRSIREVLTRHDKDREWKTDAPRLSRSPLDGID